MSGRPWGKKFATRRTYHNLLQDLFRKSLISQRKFEGQRRQGLILGVRQLAEKDAPGKSAGFDSFYIFTTKFCNCFLCPRFNFCSLFCSLCFCKYRYRCRSIAPFSLSFVRPPSKNTYPPFFSCFFFRMSLVNCIKSHQGYPTFSCLSL